MRYVPGRRTTYVMVAVGSALFFTAADLDRGSILQIVLLVASIVIIGLASASGIAESFAAERRDESVETS
jgi:hypothetical protein